MAPAHRVEKREKKLSKTTKGESKTSSAEVAGLFVPVHSNGLRDEMTRELAEAGGLQHRRKQERGSSFFSPSKKMRSSAEKGGVGGLLKGDILLVVRHFQVKSPTGEG